MPLWGAGGSNENKPQNDSEYEKSKTFADQRGWVYQREDGTEEVIVAIRALSGVAGDLTSKIGTGNLTQAFLLNSTLKSDTTGVLRVVWNERITPTTTGTAVVRNLPRVPILQQHVRVTPAVTSSTTILLYLTRLVSN